MSPLCDQDILSLADELRKLGQNPSHARRLLREHYATGGQIDIECLPVARALRQELSQQSTPRRSIILDRRSADDGTVKFLLQFTDGASAETVLMPSHRPDRAAGCVSSQIGCAMGCDFCASTKHGLTRNLDAGEIIEQFLQLKREAIEQNRRLNSLVFMGMGEPMHNLDAVILAIRRISDPDLGALGPRHITVSTVGIVPGIQRLADENLGVHLALSLHAPDDETRQRLVPVGRRYRVAEILAAARSFQERSGRIGTIEYCLLAGVNDSDAQAIELARLVHGWRVHVNIIPHNPIGAGLSGALYRRPAPQRIARFVELLREGGAVAHIRRARGDDVDAACGQLREQLFQVEKAALTNKDKTYAQTHG